MQLLVKSVRNETADTLSVLFEKPQDFKFYPAQFIDLQLDISFDNSRIFSLSTSPTEADLMITFKKGITEYKKFLEKIKPGSKVNITHPNGTYTLDESSPAIMLAGGVGIAPYRSMIKYAVDKNLKTPLFLIYSNRDDDFIFRKELDLWLKQYSKLRIKYITTSKEGRLTKAKLASILSSLTSRSQPIYYLAGPPSFVSDMENILYSLGMDRADIRLDSFDGYN